MNIDEIIWSDGVVQLGYMPECGLLGMAYTTF